MKSFTMEKSGSGYVLVNDKPNPWKYNYFACGGKEGICGYATIKEARWDARAKGQMVVDNDGNVIYDYRD